jgi:hypothetical protein
MSYSNARKERASYNRNMPVFQAGAMWERERIAGLLRRFHLPPEFDEPLRLLIEQVEHPK